MKKSKLVKKIIAKECEIWGVAYPHAKEVLKKFSNKLIFELQYRVQDPKMAI